MWPSSYEPVCPQLLIHGWDPICTTRSPSLSSMRCNCCSCSSKWHIMCLCANNAIKPGWLWRQVWHHWQYCWWFSENWSWYPAEHHSLTPLAILLVVLRELKLVSRRTPKKDRAAEYAKFFLDAFIADNMLKRRDMHCVYELAANRTRLILDKNWNEDTLRKQESKGC